MYSVLHTSSVYGITDIDLNFQKREDLNYAALEAKEAELYKKFGKNTYEDFLITIRDLFNGEDRKIIQRFSPSELSPRIETFTTKSAGIYQPEVKFSFDWSQLSESNTKIREDIRKSFTLKNKDLIVSNTVTDEFFNFSIDDKQLQNFIKDHFSYHRYKKDWSKYLHSFMKSLSAYNVVKAYGKNPETGSFDVPLKFATIPNFPWGVLKEDVELAKQLGNSDELVQELKRATDTIKNFIFSELGGGATPDLKKAIEITWNTNFGPKRNDPLLFFSGGTKGNFISGVQGALGEFQSALIFNYLGMKIGDPALAKIVGSAYKNNEQLRTDVNIFSNIGIQVKNFNSMINEGNLGFVNDRSIGSTIHPVDFSQYLPNKNNFLDFLANYYFNTTYQEEVRDDFEELIIDLGNYLGEIMNMSINNVLKDTFSFYLISGKYLVPGSRILKMADQINLRNSIEITSSYHGLPDLAYEMPMLERKDGRRRPVYTDYWVKRSGNWEPTGKNRQTYDQLISKLISIRTNFDIIKEIEKYALF
jgi:hypothetical protein